MKWIDLRELVLIHELVINKTGGVHGIINPGALESALLRPFSSFAGKEHYPDIWSKTAAFIHSLITFPSLCRWQQAHRLRGRRDYSETQWLKHQAVGGKRGLFLGHCRGEKSVEEIKAWLKSHSEPS